MDFENEIICGDNMEVMAGMADNVIDTIITDPPYGLGFMGKEWDTFEQGYLKNLEPQIGKNKNVSHSLSKIDGKYDLSRNPEFQQWFTLWAKEVLRIAKPGAMMLVFGGTRTFHRLACAIEDAGWEIRDCMMWLYGSGFPKSHDISKAIDKAKGAERGKRLVPTKKGNLPEQAGDIALGATGMTDISKPATDLAKQWDGWGTALKPAWEPIIVAMKPLDGTFAHNAERWGVGGLWIDGGRIGTEIRKSHGMSSLGVMHDDNWKPKEIEKEAQGRWPANLLLDDQATELLDEQSGISKSVIRNPAGGKIYGRNALLESKTVDNTIRGMSDSGGASRFFYCAKASRSERNAGLQGAEATLFSDEDKGMEEKRKVYRATCNGTKEPSKGQERFTSFMQNNHPTVKPLKLMEYLCRLTRTPAGGIVLDPFGGSGTTAVACRNTGRNYIIIEKDPHYCEIARGRVKETVLCMKKQCESVSEK